MVLPADQRRYYDQYRLFLEFIETTLANRALDFTDIQPHYQAVLTAFETLSTTRQQELIVTAPLRPMAFLQNAELNDATLDDIRQNLMAHCKHIKTTSTFQPYLDAICSYFTAVIALRAARKRDDIVCKHWYTLLNNTYYAIAQHAQHPICKPPDARMVSFASISTQTVTDLRTTLCSYDCK
jgi:hypothetical protein